MTLDELIARLQTIRDAGGEPVRMGAATVVAQCPVKGIDCWLHEENITVEYSNIPVVRIQGGFGA